MRWAIRNDGGVSENGLGMPRGVNPNDKTVMINPPGHTWRGLMKTFHWLFPAERKNVYGEPPYRMTSKPCSVWQQAVRQLCE